MLVNVDRSAAGRQKFVLTPHQVELKSAAYDLHRFGANILIIGRRGGGKIPLSQRHKWTYLKISRQERENLYRLPFWYAAGIAVMNGQGSWRSVDFDSCRDFDPVGRFIFALGLPAEYSYVEKT